jgi:hypothetical protein
MTVHALALWSAQIGCNQWGTKAFSLSEPLAQNWLRVHVSSMDSQARRIASLIVVFNAVALPVLADEPEPTPAAERFSQEDMAEQLRKAREADRRREARRQEALRENEAAKTVRAIAPPKESPEEQRARELREAEARREVRAADRLRSSNREAARRARERRAADR